MAQDETRDYASAPAADNTTMFLFGASGDLAKRLLIPSLYNLDREGLLDPNMEIVGVDISEGDDDSFRDSLTDFIAEKAADKHAEGGGNGLDETHWREFSQRLHYMQGDFTEDETFQRIEEYIGQREGKNALFYLATAPRFFAEIAENLGQAGLLKESSDSYRRVVVEKPFGRDLESARELNARLLSVMQEEQIYRIDHFLGKETVQNILVARFANVLFEPFWNNHYIDHIQITAAETVGVEQRAAFYDKNGALRDMVPNHLFQLLAMVAIEPPASFSADALRSEKAKVLGAIRPWSKEDARDNSVRGQYRAGNIKGESVPGYREEPGVDENSNTETYAGMKVMVDNWRWVGVPFYLRTGKRMSARDTEITICFKPAPYAQFRNTDNTNVDQLGSNYLVIQIQPNEGLWFDFQAKRPGPTLDMDTIKMGFAYKDFYDLPATTGYETLVYDCLTGDQMLFQRVDTIENGWRAVQPFLDAWEEDDSVDGYAAGEDGPESAHEMLRRDGREWHKVGEVTGPGKAPIPGGQRRK
ncbi:glucose-6-phosphate dehydrogenase [Kushneria phosphatilytica]|uniref:Glucose-6-phosphate 1-dehydrogenase n=1 Tax=Kushneria phosphatilytica TaxID=657387 RepID=A0A1S1NYQ9_9GAMM|nr:glucose-6-phosphate dehydrogenase [Kushneria phosphatilytica]OHV10525.1 glucose-6-phosphate dehydrogenase [Kushneria phosphatilytica]QEL11910.1 glucose-6-phosphate dehydrogenase [Kushneria phosphatilytica]